MKVRLLHSLALIYWLTAGLAAAQTVPQPGTPLDPNMPFGTVEIQDQQAVLLKGLVQPGDVVLLQNPALGTDRTNWSDVVRFFNIGNQGIAFPIGDGEQGIPATLLPALASNHVFINETQVGTGSDATDTTTYTIVQNMLFPATYRIHSEAFLPGVVEPPETPGPGTKPPGAPLDGMIHVFQIPDSGNTETGLYPLIDSITGKPFPVQPSLIDPVTGNPIPVSVPDANGLVSDNLIFGTIGMQSFVFVSSDLPGGVAPPGGDAGEIYNAFDEGPGAIYLPGDDEVEVPEPSALALISFGAFAVLGFAALRRT